MTKPKFEIDNMAWNKQTSKVEALYYAGNMSIYLPMWSLVQLLFDSWGDIENHHFLAMGGSSLQI